MGQAINDQEKIEVIKDNYPAFYLTFCSDCNLSDKTTQFINECSLLRDVGPKQYSKFVHGYVLPTLHLQREAGLLVKGKFTQLQQASLLQSLTRRMRLTILSTLVRLMAKGNNMGTEQKNLLTDHTWVALGLRKVGGSMECAVLRG